MIDTPVLEQYYDPEAHHLPASSFVKLARRKRSNLRRNSLTNKPTLKAQGRPLAAQTRVRFTLVENLNSLYNELVPGPSRRAIEVLKVGNDRVEESLNEIQEFEKSKLNIKPALFIENSQPTRQQSQLSYNTIDEAISQLFDLSDYTLLRITRAAATEPGGTALLKVESAMPGDKHLNDDEYDDNAVVVNDSILGQPGDRPSTTFLKKKVARPRYKADMRIYLLPRIANVVLYLEERMLKRDLLKGVLDLSKDERTILCSFDPSQVLSEVNTIDFKRNSVSSPYQLNHLPQQHSEDLMQAVSYVDHRTLPPIPYQALSTSQDPLVQYYSLLQQLPAPPVGQPFATFNNFYHPQQLQQEPYTGGGYNNFNFGSIYSANSDLGGSL